jgi:hypothetical protein
LQTFLRGVDEANRRDLISMSSFASLLSRAILQLRFHLKARTTMFGGFLKKHQTGDETGAGGRLVRLSAAVDPRTARRRRPLDTNLRSGRRHVDAAGGVPRGLGRATGLPTNLQGGVEMPFADYPRHPKIYRRVLL